MPLFPASMSEELMRHSTLEPCLGRVAQASDACHSITRAHRANGGRPRSIVDTGATGSAPRDSWCRIGQSAASRAASLFNSKEDLATIS